MKEVVGKYCTAKIFTDEVENSAIGQLTTLCNQPFTEGCIIRVMPDVHAGKGSTIGTTMTYLDKVCPFIVGMDISCGVLVVKLREKRIDLPKLDSVIHNNIPTGSNLRKKTHRFARDSKIDELVAYCGDYIDGQLAIGTLGSGNHFISIEKDEEENLYLLIHTGSRNPGKRVCEWYQEKAYKNLKKQQIKEPIYELSFVYGEMLDNYLHDMEILEEYSHLNRTAIADVILSEMKLHDMESFETLHNYVDLEHKIIRKGSVSAQKGEQLVIPINMKDGSLICVGKGNKEWNYSAPHGAGRLMSRKESEQNFTLSQYKKEMKGIYSTTICKETLDESPMSYKPIESILDNISDTVDVIKHIKPIYNFKGIEFRGGRKGK